MGFQEDKKGKIYAIVGAAYMNNGLAIVLSALYINLADTHRLNQELICKIHEKVIFYSVWFN